MKLIERVAAERKNVTLGGGQGFNQPPFWTLDQYRSGLWSYVQPDRERIENDFAGFVAGAYKADGIVFACIQTRQLVFSEARFQWQAPRGGRPGPLFGTPELSLIERPWPGGTTSDLLARMEVDLSLAGNFYATVADDAGRLGRAATGTGRRICHLRPDWVTIIVSSASGDPRAADARPVGYLYEPPPTGQGSRSDPVVLMPSEVCHYAGLTPDPIAQFRGMSWLTSVLTEISSDRAATTHKYRFFENGASLSTLVSFDKEVGVDAFNEFVDKFNEDHKGTDNAYRCLHPETEVALWNGARCRADEIEAGDLVVSWTDGKPAPGVVSRVEIQPPSPIIEVTTQRGRTVKTNEPHPFLTARGWVAAGDLVEGDRLVTGLGWGRPRLQDSVSPSDAWLLGVLVGDGCFVSSTPTVTATDPGVLAQLQQVATLVKTNNPRGPYDHRVTGIAPLVRVSGMAGKRSWEKSVPPAVMTGGSDVVCAFVAGLIDSDGHVTDPATGRSEIGITSTSHQLLKDVQHLLASLGVNASVGQPPSMRVGACGGGSGAPRRHDAYRLHVFGSQQAAILDDLLTLRHTTKAQRLHEHAKRVSRQDRSRFDRVISVRSLPAEPTIGIEVASHHTHVTGGVVTHNTLFLGAGATATVVGADLRQLDFKAVQGAIETRIASASGVGSVVAQFSEGMQGSSLNAGNYSAARRRAGDALFRPLWGSAASSLQVLLDPPSSAANLVPDLRTVAFLREDAKDQAEIQGIESRTIRTLLDAGYLAESVVDAVTSGDWTRLKHSGLFSVQLQPPNTTAPPSDAEPSTNGDRPALPVGSN